MLNIVKGNDLTLNIPLQKVINNEGVITTEDFDISSNVVLQVFLGNSNERKEYPYVVDKNIVKVLIDGSKIEIGTYYIEIVAKMGDNNFRSKQVTKFNIVDTNELANIDDDTEFSYTVYNIEGVEIIPYGMNAYELSIKNGFVGSEKDWVDSITKPSEDAKEAAIKANKAAASANDTAEHPTIVSQDGYVMFWNKQTQIYDKSEISLIGKPFKPTYFPKSVSELTSNDEHSIGTIAMIATNNPNIDDDNGRTYIKLEDGTWKFLVDLSGVQGIHGLTPQFRIGNVTTLSYNSSVSVSLTDGGNDTDGNPIYLLNIGIPIGKPLTYNDLTPSQIAELQRPAKEMIVTLKETNDTAFNNEQNRKAAEQRRVLNENTRVSNENERIANEKQRNKEWEELKKQIQALLS